MTGLIYRCRDCDARFCDEGCREKGALIHALDHRYGYGSGLKKAGMCEMVAKALYEFPDEEMKACLASESLRFSVVVSLHFLLFTHEPFSTLQKNIVH